MGIRLVRNIVKEQLKGTLQIKRNKGTEFIIEF
jgi:two-component sensor histidine kinase